MQEAKTNYLVVTPRLNKFVLPLLIVILLGGVGFLVFKSVNASRSSRPKITLSPSALEEQYGLRVSLIGMTAAGGMVDLRLKIVDGEKARALLQAKDNFPSLQLVKSGRTLSPSEDSKSQVIKFENGLSLFLMYPNAGNAVKSGATVTVRFGDIALEPIEVK
jgi:hypothetical protein